MHPYEGLDDKFFWSTAVARRNMFDIDDLWDPKFPVYPDDRFVTFGSCFAQHIGRALAERKFNWLITEPAPDGLSATSAKQFNYGLFSARTGNIYTTSLLRQWIRWATGESAVPDEAWEQDGRCYDPFRPAIEPGGFASKGEMLRSRQRALDAFRECIRSANVWVFTLGLTESWHNRETGVEYPMCPGTVAGTFDGKKHAFVRQDFGLVYENLEASIRRIRELNPDMVFLLTVSPVPLTATLSGDHVLVATMESKSILRAVAGQLRNRFDFIDYFPSYEIVNAAPFRGTYFEPNQRSVNSVGVAQVMAHFFSGIDAKYSPWYLPDDDAAGEPGQADLHAPAGAMTDDDVACEEAILAAFGGNAKTGGTAP